MNGVALELLCATIVSWTQQTYDLVASAAKISALRFASPPVTATRTQARAFGSTTQSWKLTRLTTAALFPSALVARAA